LEADWGTNAEALAMVAARNATFIIFHRFINRDYGQEERAS
jgi:hypothetical protein